MKERALQISLTVMLALLTLICVCAAFLRIVPLPVSEQQTNHIAEGMTADAAIKLLGKPHDQKLYENGSRDWYYYYDSLGLRYFAIGLDGDGNVVDLWN